MPTPIGPIGPMSGYTSPFQDPSMQVRDYLDDLSASLQDPEKNWSHIRSDIQALKSMKGQLGMYEKHAIDRIVTFFGTGFPTAAPSDLEEFKSQIAEARAKYF